MRHDSGQHQLNPLAVCAGLTYSRPCHILTAEADTVLWEQLRRLLLPTRDGVQEGPCLLDLLIGAPALQLPLVALVLDVLLQCCQQVGVVHSLPLAHAPSLRTAMQVWTSRLLGLESC